MPSPPRFASAFLALAALSSLTLSGCSSSSTPAASADAGHPADTGARVRDAASTSSTAPRDAGHGSSSSEGVDAAHASGSSRSSALGSSATIADAGAADGGPDLDMKASDFTCILAWNKVGHYRITNKLGDLTGALSVAGSADGGVFPVGTVIQLIPNEAMVKRREGFNTATRDWEFFNLTTSASGTVINQRGGANVTNFTGSSCASCHGAAAPQWDDVCGTTHGCAPLPISETTIQMIQDGDPRCGDAGVDGG